MLPYIVRHPRTLAAAGVALVVSALAMLSIPVAVRRMIDVGFGVGDGMLIANYFAMLIVIGVVLAAASAARFSSSTGSASASWRTCAATCSGTSGCSGRLLRDGAFRRGDERLTADTTQIKAAAGTAISQALRNLIMLIGALVMMFVTSASLSLLLLVAIPAIVLPLVAYGRLVRRLSRHAQGPARGGLRVRRREPRRGAHMQAFTHEHAAAMRFAGSVERAFEAARARLRPARG